MYKTHTLYFYRQGHSFTIQLLILATNSTHLRCYIELHNMGQLRLPQNL